LTLTSSPPSSATQELPLTPEMRGIITQQTQRLRRMSIGIAVATFVIMLAIGIWISAANASAGVEPVLWLGGAGLLLGLLIWGLVEVVLRRSTGQDLDAGVYCRTDGPIHVVKETREDSDGNTRQVSVLILADRRFDVSGRDLNQKLSSVDYGTVEYSPKGHIVFSVRDRTGAVVYARPGYTPGPQSNPLRGARAQATQ
jgi:hypothetical protein